ncbi:hypothetical protein [Mycobacterium simiae]|nr:hypothetical protein [Mycobacterium simiae]
MAINVAINDEIGDEFAHGGCDLESVPAQARGDDRALQFRLAR